MIYIKTELGQTAMQRRSVAMTPGQRSAFIMFDGKRDSSEVLKMTSRMGVTPEDVIHLVSLGLLAPLDDAADSSLALAAIPATAAVNAVVVGTSSAALSQTADGKPTLSAQTHYSRAYPIATRLTASLGLRGFRLNLAVEAAGNLDKLKELAPKIKAAVGPEKFLELENALYY